jgi:hypothetical protein
VALCGSSSGCPRLPLSHPASHDMSDRRVAPATSAAGGRRRGESSSGIDESSSAANESTSATVDWSHVVAPCLERDQPDAPAWRGEGAGGAGEGARARAA